MRLAGKPVEAKHAEVIFKSETLQHSANDACQRARIVAAEAQVARITVKRQRERTLQRSRLHIALTATLIERVRNMALQNSSLGGAANPPATSESRAPRV